MRGLALHSALQLMFNLLEGLPAAFSRCSLGKEVSASRITNVSTTNSLHTRVDGNCWARMQLRQESLDNQQHQGGERSAH